MVLVGFSKVFFSQDKGFSDEKAFGVVDELWWSVEPAFKDLVDDDTVFFIDYCKVGIVDFGDLLKLIEGVELPEDGRYWLWIRGNRLLFRLDRSGFIGFWVDCCVGWGLVGFCCGVSGCGVGRCIGFVIGWGWTQSFVCGLIGGFVGNSRVDSCVFVGLIFVVFFRKEIIERKLFGKKNALVFCQIKAYQVLLIRKDKQLTIFQQLKVSLLQVWSYLFWWWNCVVGNVLTFFVRQGFVGVFFVIDWVVFLMDFGAWVDVL
jgi:hypothetical protein